MSIDLRHLNAFIAVAEELRFRRAAERVHLAQPALSRTVHQLEEHIGAPLLLRSTRNVTLTDAGRAFLPEARNTTLAAARAVAAMATRAARSSRLPRARRPTAMLQASRAANTWMSSMVRKGLR